MGIPGFYGEWLKNYVPTAINTFKPQYVASLAFDLNGTIHQAKELIFPSKLDNLRLLKTEGIDNIMDRFFQLITDLILQTVQILNPYDCLILAVDGVAPAGKIQQQRSRRFKSAENKHPLFDSNSITPGTEFMIKLDYYLRDFIKEKRSQLPPRVIYSSHLVPGEGEHKIMEYYRQGLVSQGVSSKKGGSHLIYGLDADLILLSLVAPINDIYLYRDEKSIVNINEIKNYLVKLTGDVNTINDFLFMMSLVGNDFLPKLPSVEAVGDMVNYLLDTYKSLKSPLTQGPNILWDNVRSFLNTLAQNEANTMAEMVVPIQTKANRHPSRFLRASIVNDSFHYEIFRSAWYNNALGAKDTSEFAQQIGTILGKYTNTDNDLFRNSAFSSVSNVVSEINTNDIIKMCKDYLRTLAWVYTYYKTGHNGINIDFYYAYHHAPMLTDISAVLATTSITDYEANPYMSKFNALHQLLAVIPKKSIEILPEELRIFYSYNSPILDLYPDRFITEMDGKFKEHEAIAIIPFIDKQRIIEALSTVIFAPERAQLWLPAEMTIDDQERVRTEFQPRGRGEFQPRGRGEFQPRGRGEFQTRGRGEFQPRGRGEIQPRGRGEFQPRGRGEFQPRGRGEFQPRGRGEFQPRGRGEFQPRGSRNDMIGGQFKSRGSVNFTPKTISRAPTSTLVMDTKLPDISKLEFK